MQRNSRSSVPVHSHLQSSAARVISRGPSIDQRPSTSSGGPGLTHLATRLSETKRLTTLSREDPRPLSDKSFQKQCIKKLVDFLAQNGYQHQVSIASLSSPSLTDFFRIFEFLYCLLSRSFKPGVNPIDQITNIIKSVGYPFAISKSHLLNPRSCQSWGHSLGFFVWLIDIIRYWKHYQPMPAHCTKFTRLNSKQAELVAKKAEQWDKSISEVLLELTAQMFKAQRDNTSADFTNELRDLVKDYYGVDEDLEGVMEEHDRLQQESQAAQETLKSAKLQKLEEEQMLNNLDVLRKYYQELDEYLSALQKSRDDLKKEVASLEIDLTKLKTEKRAKMELHLLQRSQGLNVELIKKQRSQLLTELEADKLKLNELQQKFKFEMDNHEDFQQVCHKFEDFRKQFSEALKNNLELYSRCNPEVINRIKQLDFSSLNGNTKQLSKAVEQLILDLSSNERHVNNEGILKYETAIRKGKRMLNQLHCQKRLLASAIEEDERAIVFEEKQAKEVLKQLESKLSALKEDSAQIQSEIIENMELINNPPLLKSIQDKNDSLEQQIKDIDKKYDEDKARFHKELLSVVKTLKEEADSWTGQSSHNRETFTSLADKLEKLTPK